MKLQKSFVIPPVLIFGILIILLSTVQQSTTFGQTIDSETKSVNGVSVRAVFNFNAGVEEITTFQVFKILEGFKEREPLRFELVGIIDGNKPMLHTATHEASHKVKHETQYSEFDIELYITDNYSLNTLLLFTDCYINDFSVETFYDKNKTWQGDLKFAWLETFEFQCAGAHPFHLVEVITKKVSEEKEPLTWEDLYP